MIPSFDIVFLGGGLHSSLSAIALSRAHPTLGIAVVESGPTIGGNHLWSTHASDVPDGMPWLDHLTAYRWSKHEVRFPDSSRVIESGYQSITSESLHQYMVSHFASAPKRSLFLKSHVARANDRRVLLSSGQELRASVVLDGRGDRDREFEGCGFQKFCGQEFELNSDHEFAHPILMDARVEQVDGFRFVYVLPLTPRRLFLEDTYFSADASLDKEAIRTRLSDYAGDLGLDIKTVGREEFGVLPMPWKEQANFQNEPTAIGVRGGFYHPATAYSLPIALRVAKEATECHSPADLVQRIAVLREVHQKQARFGRLLNRLLFGSYAPKDRIHIFEKFYRLPLGTIERFYSMNMTFRDQFRILSGRPPSGFSLRRSLRNLGAPSL